MIERILLSLFAVIGVPLLLAAYIAAGELGLRAIGNGRSARLRPWLWLAPALVLLLVFLVYPALNTLYLSFLNATSIRWAGLDNFQYVFTNPTMQTALRNNAIWIVLFTALVVGFGLVLAVLTDRV